MNRTFYPVVFHPEEAGFSVSVPDIDGCFTQGDTMAEAVSMAQDAMGLMLEDCFKSGRQLPAPSLPGDIPLEPGDFVTMVEFDEAAYRKRHDRRSVKKTLTLPAWLDRLAEENGVNFSQTLQSALKRELGVR